MIQHIGEVCCCRADTRNCANERRKRRPISASLRRLGAGSEARPPGLSISTISWSSLSRVCSGTGGLSSAKRLAFGLVQEGRYHRLREALDRVPPAAALGSDVLTKSAI